MMRTLAGGAAALALLAAAMPTHAATVTTQHTFRLEGGTPAGLKIANFVGDLRVEGSDAGGFDVTATVTAEADSDAEARAIAEAVGFRTQDAGSSASLEVVLPREQFPVIYYGGAPQGWFAGRMNADYLGERRRVTGDPDKGVRVRVDLVVRAPAGARLDARNIFGDAEADGFSGDLSLEGAAGRLGSRNGEGRLVFDSGSGPVEVASHSGPVSADTGSGPVTVRDCRCQIVADTGSGSVRIEGGEGEINADTGSGAVEVRDFRGLLRADTGSGAVRASGVSGVTELIVDTGSGGVAVSGDLSALRRLFIDTGSGGVTLESVAWPAMELVLDSGSGGVHVDVPGAEVHRDEDRRSVVRVGEGGFRGRIDTGSGSIHLRTTVPAT